MILFEKALENKSILQHRRNQIKILEAKGIWIRFMAH
jgi:hypothetical protein